MAVRKIVTDINGLKWDTSTWGGAYASHASIRARNIKFAPTLNLHAPGFTKPEEMRGPDPSIVGGYGGDLSFDVALRPEAAVATEMRYMLEQAGTLNKRAAASAKITAATSSTIVGLTADIGTYVVGDAVFVYGSGTDPQMRFITRVQDDVPAPLSTTLTVTPNFTDTPANGDSLRAVDTWTPKIGDPGAYYQFLMYQGGDATNSHLFTISDCSLANWKLSALAADSLPYISCSFKADSWTSTDSSAATLANEALSVGWPVLGDSFYVDNSAVAVESLEFDAGMDLQPYTATSGTNGRAGWFCAGCMPKLSIKPYHDVDWITRLTAGTTFSGCFESVNGTSRGWALWVPKLQVVSIAPDALGNKLLGDMPELLVCDPGKNADSTNYPLFAFAATSLGS